MPTLKFYSEKLWKARLYSTSKLNMFFKQYIILQDGYAKKFNDPSIQKDIWEQLNALRQVSMSDRLSLAANHSDDSDDKAEAPPPAARFCSKCGSRTIHAKITPSNSWSTCPFHSVPKEVARKARALVNAYLRVNQLEQTSMAIVREKITETKAQLKKKKDDKENDNE